MAGAAAGGGAMGLEDAEHAHMLTALRQASNKQSTCRTRGSYACLVLPLLAMVHPQHLHVLNGLGRRHSTGMK